MTKSPAAGTPPRALLFDWDNTLIDSWVTIHHALKVTFEAMGQQPWSLAQAKDRVRASARDTFPQLFGERSPEALQIFYDTYEADHLDKLTPLPGADAMLRHLRSRNDCYMAVISNKKGTLLRAEAARLGWDSLFERLVGATDAARDKPAVEAVELALQGSGLPAGPGIWLIGDTDIDMACAADSGCTPVLLRPEPPRAGEFAGCEPLHYIGSCSALIGLVEEYIQS